MRSFKIQSRRKKKIQSRILNRLFSSHGPLLLSGTYLKAYIDGKIIEQERSRWGIGNGKPKFKLCDDRQVMEPSWNSTYLSVNVGVVEQDDL